VVVAALLAWFTFAVTSARADANTSQFYVTLKRLPELDGRSVAVGTLLEGWAVLDALDAAAMNAGGRFAKGTDFRVRACGELKDWRPERRRGWGAR
jgi:cyclophilin family peptidyl-prolyl cis-trans isomerase